MGEDGSFSSPVDVLVHDGIIAKISPEISVDQIEKTDRAGVIAEHYTVVDGKGKYLVPGIFDCHIHAAMHSGDAWANLQEPYSLHVLKTANNLKTLLRSGVTFIRDAGGMDAGFRQALEDGEIEGPQMQVSINLLCQTGGHMDSYLPSEDAHVATEGFMVQYAGRPPYRVDGCDEVRKTVRELIQQGADWIKLCATGGIFSGVGGSAAPQFSPEEFRTAVFEAHKAGKHVMVHAVGGEGITWAIEAGADSIEHGVFMTDEQIALMKEKEICFVPTLTVYHHLADLACMENSPLPAALQKSGHILKENLGISVRKARAAGIPIALGIDSASRDTHGRSLEEIYYLYKAGLTMQEALLAATVNGAKLCGVDDHLGYLKEGYRFDALLMNEDPLTPEIYLREQVPEAVYHHGCPVV